MMKKRHILVLWIIYSAVIFVISALPSTAVKSNIPHFDKLLHAGAFVVFALLGYVSISSERPEGTKWAMVLITAAVYGAAIETIQYFVPGRESSFYDWLADIFGAVLGLLLANLARKLLHSR